MLNIPRPQLFKAVVVICILIITGVAVYSLLLNKSPNKEQAEVTGSNTFKRGKVFVKDLYKYIDSETKDSVEQTLYEHANGGVPDLYTATIRPGSYSKKVEPSRQTVIQLVVDVEPIKSTYNISLMSYHGIYSINIWCAAPEAQLSPSSKCKDLNIS